VIDDQRVPVEIEDDDSSTRARYANHLRERPAGIREVLKQARCSTDVECAVGKRKRSRFADLERDGQRALFGAPSGFGDHDFACIQSNELATRADALDHVEQVVPWAAAGIQDRFAGRQCGAFHHESLARLDGVGLLRLIHEPDKEIGILCAVNLREEIGMRTHPSGRRATMSIVCAAAYEDRLAERLPARVIADAIAMDDEQRELRREASAPSPSQPRTDRSSAAAEPRRRSPTCRLWRRRRRPVFVARGSTAPRWGSHRPRVQAALRL
jgi:hypothetical protein